MPQSFMLIDVFGEDDFSGNPLAVIADADGLDSAAMQRIARWLNLSETCFLFPPRHPDADYHVRIFTLERELPFAGHPTLGTCHAWLERGGVPKSGGLVIQECGAGLVPIRRSDAMLAFAAPPVIRSGAVDDETLAEIADVLHIPRGAILDAQWVDNGPGWVAVMLSSAEAVLALEPARDHPTRLELGVVGMYPPGGATAYEVRAIFSDQNLNLIEDPVTGSLNASIAQWLIGTSRVSAPFVAAQGTCLGRTGRIHVSQDAAGIWIGGRTRSLFSGGHELGARGY